METSKKNGQKAIPIRPKANPKNTPQRDLRSLTIKHSQYLHSSQHTNNTNHKQQEDNSFNPFPWNFTPKWPLTRAERIHELQRVAPFYESTYQKENIAAAIHWHSQFGPYEICPEGLVFFRKGRMIEESEVRLEDGIPWPEVS